jgi:hypothetical protein
VFRDFIALVAGATGWPRATRAQQPSGLLSVADEVIE